MDDEVLHIGDDAPGGEASPVTEFVHGKFWDIHAVEIHLPHGSVCQHPVKGSGISNAFLRDRVPLTGVNALP